MSDDTWKLLGKLKRAVTKIKVLLNLNLNIWKLSSIIGTSSSSRVRRLSFGDRPGLRACEDESGPNEGSGSFRRLHRTTSYPLSDDNDSDSDNDNDIDKKAGAFIANFHKQLRYERQISLQLRYYKNGN